MKTLIPIDPPIPANFRSMVRSCDCKGGWWFSDMPSQGGPRELSEFNKWQHVYPKCPHKHGDKLPVREDYDIVDDPSAHDPKEGSNRFVFEGKVYTAPVIAKRGPKGERWVVDYRADKNTRIMDMQGKRGWREASTMPAWAVRRWETVESIGVECLEGIWHWVIQTNESE